MLYFSKGELMKRFSNVNGKATKLGKPLTNGSIDFIVFNAGRISAKNIANILHRPLKTVQSVASRFGVSLKLS
jgi:hypothetical protein